jgi:hypothetical protein
VQTGLGGVSLSATNDAAPLLRGVGYQACDDQGVVFKTADATEDGDGLLRFTLEGPGAADAEVTAHLTRLPRGLTLDWTVRYTGPAKAWNVWSSGFTYDFGRPIAGAWTRPVTKWVTPTGAAPYEVPGDTPYPDTECQLRGVDLGDAALVLVSSTYDADWIYGNDKERARFSRLALPAGTPSELSTRISFLVTPPGQPEPEALAAEAAGRPVALSLSTGRTGNLFTPGETIPLRCEVRNVTDAPQRCQVTLRAWTYQGAQILDQTRDLSLDPQSTQAQTSPLACDLRGVVFVAATLTWEGGQWPTRMTCGVLPERPASGVAPGSPFAMAAAIANPQAYPDHWDLPTVVRQMQRIGVRWVRGGWFPLKDDPTDADEQTVRQRVSVLREAGILPHVQLGSGVIPAEERDAFCRRLAACLERFGWVTPYVEVGNELNFNTSPTDYIEGLLRPVSETLRRALPQGKVMSMGLGGVTPDWLNGFVAAGGMDLIDVLSVHPGCQPKCPEFWEGWRGWVFRSQMLDAARACQENGGKELWITEAYAPTPPDRSAVDLRTAADYLVRTYVCSLALGVKVVEWYQFQDGVWYAQRQYPADSEYNFGIVYTDLSPKPGYVAFGAMTEQLESKPCRGRLDLGVADLYAVRFGADADPVDVLWSTRERHEVDVPWWPPEQYKDISRKPGEPWVERWRQPVEVELPAAGPVTVTDLMGNMREAPVVGGKVRLALSGSPVYVRGLGDMVRLPALWEPVP